MEVVILCGGMGTRLQEITDTIPKPLIPIGNLPMIRHIMNHYMDYGHTEFVLALGYKQEAFKHYFLNAHELEQDVSIQYGGFTTLVEQKTFQSFKVNLIFTGEKTNPATRLYKLRNTIISRTFLFTYGDGVSTIDINETIEVHTRNNAIVTITGVHPPSKFGELNYTGNIVTAFEEKPKTGCITNGGFMVMDNAIFEYLPHDNEWDFDNVFRTLITHKKLCVYQHTGFWKNADTLKDIGELREMWDSGNAPWIKGE